MNERLWTVAEIAEKFGVSKSAVQGWIRKGHLPGARKKGPGRNSPYIVPQRAVDDLVKRVMGSQTVQES